MTGGQNNKVIKALTPSPKSRIIKGVGFVRLEIYVQFAVPHITTILLVLHLAMGCCLHHAHQCVAYCCDAPGPVAEACPCDSHSDHEEDHDATLAELASDAGGHQPSHQHRCEGDQCTFLRSTGPVLGEMGEMQLSLNALDVLPLSVGAGCESHDARREAGASLRSPLRAHLLFSILLI